ncbi:MAG: TIGR01244 family phosphatase [Hyphomicrobiaceae bacterium]|nr:TIGR01244 family phosphatase [Hyphomicrobiaceae bacterium]
MQNIVYLTPNFAVTSAPTPADFAEIARLGFKSVLSNRPDDEEQGQLDARQSAKLAWAAGLRYRHVPTAKHDVFTDEVVEGMADALIGLPGPVLAHCKSGLRSAIVWAAASARSQPVDCVLEALQKSGFDLDFLRDDLDAQADRARWLPPSKALDCECEVLPVTSKIVVSKTGTAG